MLLLKSNMYKRQTVFEVGMSHDGDYGCGNIRQAWMAAIEKA